MSECTPSSPDVMSNVPEFIITSDVPWIASSTVSIVNVPPSIVITPSALIPFWLTLFESESTLSAVSFIIPPPKPPPAI